jgi:ABC-type uncharacterized transport system auxiliary subunit
MRERVGNIRWAAALDAAFGKAATELVFWTSSVV